LLLLLLLAEWHAHFFAVLSVLQFINLLLLVRQAKSINFAWLLRKKDFRWQGDSRLLSLACLLFVLGNVVRLDNGGKQTCIKNEDSNFHSINFYWFLQFLLLNSTPARRLKVAGNPL